MLLITISPILNRVGNPYFLVRYYTIDSFTLWSKIHHSAKYSPILETVPGTQWALNYCLLPLSQFLVLHLERDMDMSREEDDSMLKEFKVISYRGTTENNGDISFDGKKT